MRSSPTPPATSISRAKIAPAPHQVPPAASCTSARLTDITLDEKRMHPKGPPNPFPPTPRSASAARGQKPALEPRTSTSSSSRLRNPFREGERAMSVVTGNPPPQGNETPGPAGGRTARSGSAGTRAH